MNKGIIKAIYEEINGAYMLMKEIEKLQEQGSMPQLRWRFFVLRGTKGRYIQWPYGQNKKTASTHYIYYRTISPTSGEEEYAPYNFGADFSGLSWIISGCVGENYYAALRVLRQAQAMRAWMQARVDGLQRHVAEINRQQQRYSDLLKAEAALRLLGK